MERQEALVQAAYDLLAERGFEGLRTRDIAAKVGVNIATLHYYFPTKEKLIRGVVGYAMERFRTTLQPAGSPGEQVRAHFAGIRRRAAIRKRSTVSYARWSGLSRSGGKRLEPCGEVAELRRLVDDPVAAQLRRPLRDGLDDLDHVVDVALRVGAPRDRHADEV